MTSNNNNEMAFKFSRSIKTSSNHSNTGDVTDKPAAKFTTPTPALITAINNNTNHYKSGSYPDWLRDSAALRKAYYGSLGQVQLQPDLIENSKRSSGLDKLVTSNRKLDFAWDNFTDSSRVQQLLSTSRLPNSSLAAIWACCNKTRPGVLTNREVCLALGLIAIFQRVEQQQLEQDPFSLLKLEKNPPVPKLYETRRETSGSRARIPSSCSVPNDLLIDISNESIETPTNKNQELIGQLNSVTTSLSNNAISLIDLDSDKLEPTLVGLTNVWSRFMMSMQALFKRSFDILNVENSRASAIEALSSPAGIKFCKSLSLCYPIAHNIKFKIDELRRAQLGNKQKRIVLDDRYFKQMSNIMVSINEYWAVLINLFHGSGQTDFIELIMDGLVQAPSVEVSPSGSLDDLISSLTIENKCDTCAICLTEFYLINMGDALERSATLPQDDIDMLYDTKLISSDGDFYYHPKCANFWLNNVPGTNRKLPFESFQLTDEAILKPMN